MRLHLFQYVFCFFAVVVLLFLPAPSAAKPKPVIIVEDEQPINLEQMKYKKLFSELEQKYNFSQNELDQIFKGQKISKRVLELMDKQWKAKPYYQYFPLFLTPKTILTGRIKLKQHKKLFDRIEKEFGVNREIVTAIWAIETRYGGNQGDFNILRTLNTLFDAYPRRSEFFRKELIHF
ncbi:MAG: lytic murein transglycosylase B, partial [Candidatus Electrothrix sp. AR4]|nr:lytic murein transglycosylase B [Candidatus Electrothrix sp. AR4]